MDWRVKGVVQKALSVVPFGMEGNDLLQRTIGARRKLDRQVASKVNDDWVVLQEHMNDLDLSPEGLDFLEIGTGWYPTLPVCYALAGAGRCVTYDLHRHLDEGHTQAMIKALRAHLPAIARASQRPLAEVEAEHATLAATLGIDELLRRARIDYRAPADASKTGLPDDSIDVVFSNSVLEHIPGEVIFKIMQEAARVLRPGGLAIHSVNCGDHYAYFDKRITQINYLSYSEAEWAVWNNEIQYQNRLRAPDFLDIARRAGLEIILDKHKAQPRLLDQVKSMKVAPEFEKYPPEELACTSIDFVAKKAGPIVGRRPAVS